MQAQSLSCMVSLGLLKLMLAHSCCGNHAIGAPCSFCGRGCTSSSSRGTQCLSTFFRAILCSALLGRQPIWANTGSRLTPPGTQIRL